MMASAMCLSIALLVTTTIADAAVVATAVGKTVMLLHPALTLVGVSIWMQRGLSSNSITDGQVVAVAVARVQVVSH